MRRLSVVVAILLVAGLTLAQAPAGPPKPGPEQKRMEYFAGKWTGTGEMKASPFGPAGKMTSTETCTWFAGGFSLVCNSTGTMAGLGEMKGMGTWSYDRENKVYVYHAVNSMGEVEHATGTVNGKVWTWTDSGKKDGKPFKGTFTITEDSASSYSYKWEASIAGGPKTLIMEGKATKSK